MGGTELAALEKHKNHRNPRTGRYRVSTQAMTFRHRCPGTRDGLT